MAARPGSLVAFREGGAVALGVVVGQEKRRLRLIVAGGREQRIAPARLLGTVEAEGRVPGDTPEERREAGRRVELADRRIADRCAEIDVALLWQVVQEADAADACHATTDLVELALSARDPEAATALTRALLADGLHFRRRADGWQARGREQVAELRRERERVAEREARTEELFAALRAAVRGAEFRPSGNPWEARYLEALEALALHEGAAPEGAQALALEALAASGQRCERPHEGAFCLLLRLGRFAHEDENLQVRRYALRTEFPPHVLRHAADAAHRGFDEADREDLTALHAISIDSPYTREIDDALSLEPATGERVRLGVHIADPGAFVAPGDPVDDEALARGLSHYHPDLQLPMLPGPLSQEAASLVAGRDRPALSFLVDLERDGAVLAWRVVPSRIRVAARLDYDGCDRTIAGGDGACNELLAALSALAAAREERRGTAGAVRIDAPEVDLHVDETGRLMLERNEAGSPARRVVTEAMVLVGELAARLLGEAGLPAIYRRQAPPAAELPGPPGEAYRDPVSVRRVRRLLSRGEATLEPGRHWGLGLEAYAQVTSPLRRFADLATQRQITAHLRGRPGPYDAEAMRRIAALCERAEVEARRAERAAADYWLLRWLGERTGQVTEAVVVEVEPRPVVQLTETLWEQPLPSLSGVVPGQLVRLRIERANPRAGLLVLRRVDAVG